MDKRIINLNVRITEPEKALLELRAAELSRELNLDINISDLVRRMIRAGTQSQSKQRTDSFYTNRRTA